MNINEIAEKNKAGLLISVLGCLIFFVASFFGHNYVWEDNIILSLVFSFLATLALFFLSLFLIKYKNDPTRKGITIPEIVLLTGYALVAIVSSLFVMHFINTEFAFKEDIKKMGLAKVETLHDMREKYKEQTENKTLQQKTECETLVKGYVGSKNQKTKAASRGKLITEFKITFGVVVNEASLLEGCESYKKGKDKFYNAPISSLRSSRDGDMAVIKQDFASYSRRKIPEALKSIELWIQSDFETLKSSYPEFKYVLPEYNDVPQLNDLGESLGHPNAKNGVAIVFLLLIHFMILGWYLFRRGRKLGRFLSKEDHYK